MHPRTVVEEIVLRPQLGDIAYVRASVYCGVTFSTVFLYNIERYFIFADIVVIRV